MSEKKIEMASIQKKLWKDAKYAAASYSVELMCQTYGELQMARMLGAVDFESTRDLNGYIIRDHLNNGPWRNECEKLGRL